MNVTSKKTSREILNVKEIVTTFSIRVIFGGNHFPIVSYHGLKISTHDRDIIIKKKKTTLNTCLFTDMYNFYSL